MSGLKRLVEDAERPVLVVAEIIGVLAALAALVVSLFSLSISMQPAQEQRASRGRAIVEVLEGITGPTSEDIARARSHIAADSVADQFVAFLTDVRRVNRAAKVDNSFSIDSSSRERAYEVCLVGLKVLWTDCLPFSDFTFDDVDKITGWSIDGIPLRASFGVVNAAPNFESDQTHLAGALHSYLFHPRSDEITCLFTLGQTVLQSDEVAHVRVTDVFYLDQDYQQTGGIRLGASRIDFLQEERWAVRVPAHANIEVHYKGYDFESQIVALDPAGVTFLYAP